MGVVFVGHGGGSGAGTDGHTHPNLGSLDKLRVTGASELLVNGVPVGELAFEVRHEVILTAQHIASQGVDLPEDCDTSRALTLVLESLPQRIGDDWEVVEKTAPEKDRIEWGGRGMANRVQVGDKISITYYKRRV